MVSGGFTDTDMPPGQETGRKDTADYRGLYPEREQMTNLFVLIDCRLEPQKIDLEFMEWLGENGVPFSIIFTKADKLTNGKVKDNVNKYLKKLTEQWEELLLISYPPLKRKQADRRFWIILTALTGRLRHSVELPSGDYLERK